MSTTVAMGRLAAQHDTHRPTWMEVDLDRLTENVAEVRRVIGRQRQLIAVVKANAYGHGMEVVPTIVDAGVDVLAVGDLADVRSLREAGCELPILLFGSGLAEDIADAVVEHRAIPTVWSVESARPYSVAANEPLDVALKIDTGAHRLGALPEVAADVAAGVAALGNLRIGLAYTVFANPAEDEEFTGRQFEAFQASLAAMRAAGVSIPYASCATSAVISTRPEMQLNAVRSGNLLYGLYLPSEPRIPLRIRPAARALKTRIIQVQAIPAGEHMGYERLVTAREPAKYAVIPLGRVDGLVRSVTADGCVLVRGRRCPFIYGSLSGEHCCIDVTEVPDARPGDEVVVWGEQGDQAIALREHATWAGTREAQALIAYGGVHHEYLSRSGAGAGLA